MDFEKSGGSEINQEIVVEMKGITKRFPGIVANDRVDFQLLKGEIHAVLGENGAGKSTLMSILAGLYTPDEGEIILDGKKTIFRSPGDARRSGVGMIFQHFMLIENHTVAENIILGVDGASFFLDKSKIDSSIRELSLKYQLNVDPQAYIWQLSVGELQRVEILKSLYRNARILIMDEPTAVLTPQETSELMSTLRVLADTGNSIVFISHKLEEVMKIADRVTVLKNGKVQGEPPGPILKSETTKEKLAFLMIGRESSLARKRKKPSNDKVAFSISDLYITGERGVMVINGLNLAIMQGEILGIAGVAGNGQKYLAEAINGLMPVKSGSIKLFGEEIIGLNPREVHKRGVGFIPEDRIGMGLVSKLGLSDNMALRDYFKKPFSSGCLLNYGYINGFSQSLVRDYNIKAPEGNQPVGAMSGGNLQKILLARELSSNPKLIIAVHPSRGLDIGAVEFVHNKLIEAGKNGSAILLISEDLDELLMLSDRIAVIYEGRIIDEPIVSEKARISDIGLLMSGVLPSKDSADRKNEQDVKK